MKRNSFKSALRTLACVLAVAGLACAGLMAPAQANALEVEKLTAKPNGDTGSEVYGGSATRITWEVQAADDESLESLSITFPEDTEFSADDVRATMLTGEDLMTRESVDPEYKIDGQTLTATFPEALPAGRFLRLEIKGVTFPVEGGEESFAGSYTLTGSDEAIDINDIPSVTVTSTSAFDTFVENLEEQDWVKAWNSNMFLKLFVNPPVIVSSLPLVAKGFVMAIAIVALAFPLAIPVGFFLSLMRVSKSKVLRAIASIYVNIVRGTPAFLQIYIAFFGLPLAGFKVDNYPLGVVVMAMNSAAYLCEIFRAGIQSIPKGQSEASRSLGMTAAQTMLYVIIPQTVRNVLPTMTSEFILLYKDTSLLAAVGVSEIVMCARNIVATTGSITPYVVAAFFYLLLTLPLSKAVSLLEARLNGTARKKRKKSDVEIDAGDPVVFDSSL